MLRHPIVARFFMAEPPARLYLVTSPGLSLADLETALTAGDIACVLVSHRDTPENLVRWVQTIQAAGAAALIPNDIMAAERSGADGVHVDVGPLAPVLQRFKPAGIVGAGSLLTDHDAMEAGERGVDYVMFGDVQPGQHPAPLEERLDRIGWWAEIFQVPCVAMAQTVAEVAPFASAGADFVALGDAIWTHPAGAAAAVHEADAALQDAAAARVSAPIERV